VNPRLLRHATDRLRRGAVARRRYEAFQVEVEPGLALVPRVHRFAAVPTRIEPDTSPLALAVCIDVAGGGDVAATRASLERQRVAPAAVAEASGAGGLDALHADLVVLVYAGDRLAPRALERLGQAAALAPDAALITCDGDELDRAGRRVRPRCAPGPSPDLLLAHDHSGALLTVRQDAALAALGGRGAAGSDGESLAGPAWRYELALRLTGPDGAGHAHVPAILCHRAPRRAARGAATSDDDALLAAAARALAAWGDAPARIEPAGPGRRRVRRPVAGEPAVEAIVCLRDRPQLLARCARSVLEASTYERLALRLVDNGSADPEIPPLLARLARDPRVTVERDPRPFNFAALNNAAVARSHADVVVFLNNDAEALTPSWVEELLEDALREEVGAVAPLLLYGDGRVQHAGAAIGIHGYAGHPFAGLRPDAETPFGTATDGTRDWLAVSAACLMVERSKLDAVGGFDESFVVGGGDVDLCVRLTATDHRSLCVPHVRLRHDESASRDPLAVPAADHERSRERYGAFRMLGDPFYNPNLTLAGTNCALRAPGEEAEQLP
jgi:GT2 family glycosyltransferase